MTRYVFARLRSQRPQDDIGEAEVGGWGAQPIIDALKRLLEETEGSVSAGTYRYRSLEDDSGLDVGRIRLRGEDATILSP
jgi:hypothetical protein